MIPTIALLLVLGQQVTAAPGVELKMQKSVDVIAQPKYCSGGAPPKNDPDCIPVGASNTVWPTVATVKITAIGNLKCADNQHIEGDGKSEAGNHCVDDAPLKCGKYQHVYHWPGQCGPAPCDDRTGICTSICTPPPPDKCVDDMHTVTEREWQSLLERLKKLEDPCPKLGQVKGCLAQSIKE